jgi:hypothetical protein
MNKILTLICFVIITGSTKSFAQASWMPMGGGLGASTEEVKAIYIDPNGEIYVGGTFTGAISYAARWNGTAWSAIGSGLDGAVYAIAADSTGIIFGGAFNNAGGSAAAKIARWNGNAWNALGNGFNDIVKSIFVSSNGSLYAGGDFSASASTNINHIAKFVNGNWTVLGTGISSNVNAIMEYPSNNGTMYAGTDNTGGAAPVMKYDGTNSWTAVGTLTGGRCLALAVFSNWLYAGGDFSQPIRSGARTNDGSTWSSMNTNFSTQQVINTLYSASDALYVGGNFTGVGIGTPNYIARVPLPQNPLLAFNVSSSQLANGAVKAIGKSAGYVIAGGQFTTPTTVTNNISITSTTINVDEVADIVVNKNFYPNPVHEHATLTLNTSEPVKNPDLKVYDVQSKLVQSSANYNSHNNDLIIEIDLTKVPAGHYYYVLTSDGKAISSDIFMVE